MNILEEIQNCSVEWKELGDKNVAKLSRGKVMSKQFLEENKGEYPVYSSQTANNGEIGRISGFEYDGEYITWTTDGANAGTVFYRKGKFSITNVCGLVEINSDQLLTKFVYYYLTISTKKYVSSGMGNPKLMSNVMRKIKIPILPLEIQEKIVQILDKFTDYVTELTSELTSRKKQYYFYRDKLLSFEDEIYQVEWKTLSEIAKDFGRGKSKHRPRNDARLYGGDIPFIQTGDIREAGKWIENYSQTYSAFGLQQGKQWEKGTLCITIAANIAETGLLGFDACFPDSIIGFVANPKFAITEYVYYYLNSIKDYLANKSYGSAQDNLNLSTFSSLKIPVPSLEIQSRIVQVLDNFDMVCNDLNIGLPKEIELRQKQYEYFREKLLTFTAEGVYTDSTVQYSTDKTSLGS